MNSYSFSQNFIAKQVLRIFVGIYPKFQIEIECLQIIFDLLNVKTIAIIFRIFNVLSLFRHENSIFQSILELLFKDHVGRQVKEKKKKK
ncbi:hypothetical protein WKT22_02044 [Candidatus Lokiarchaeum ossiferum]